MGEALSTAEKLLGRLRASKNGASIYHGLLSTSRRARDASLGQLSSPPNVGLSCALDLVARCTAAIGVSARIAISKFVGEGDASRGGDGDELNGGWQARRRMGWRLFFVPAA